LVTLVVFTSGARDSFNASAKLPFVNYWASLKIIHPRADVIIPEQMRDCWMIEWCSENTDSSPEKAQTRFLPAGSNRSTIPVSAVSSPLENERQQTTCPPGDERRS
jgi:hypothetical protein